ncbi:hypothetical protein [Streptomyces sp. NPDC088557]|uniref:hypothetical protein n=1 Tax=Streptomyces sp. NPDC088557 TaxID=3365867 RepID=UPI0038130D1F
MGELADRVARLEGEVTEAQEALRVVAKIDEEIENALEEVESVQEALLNLSWELDGEIADHNYSAVERFIFTVIFPTATSATYMLNWPDHRYPRGVRHHRHVCDVVPRRAGDAGSGQDRVGDRRSRRLRPPP